MSHKCGACDGTGKCQNDHHDLIGGMVDGGTFGLAGTPCPACGETESTPGNCSVCGGEGVQYDDEW